MTAAPILWALLLSQSAPAQTRYDLNAAELERHVRFLADPAQEGRLTLYPGEHKAAEYIAKQFREAGLQEGPNPAFLHEYDITINVRPTPGQALKFAFDDGRTVELVAGADFAPLSGTATVDGVSGKLVFVGQGLVTEERDDYAGVDATGKFVLVLRTQREGQPRVTPRQVAMAAKEKGAIGVVMIGPQVEGGSELPRPSRPSGVPGDLNLAAVGVSARLSEALTGMEFSALNSAGMSPARELPVSVTLSTGTEPNKGRGRNVIGYLPGNDPKLQDEYIVIGAHYDHLGWGEVGSRTGRELIHFGADDNASGTSGVIELARFFASTKSNRRTLVFQAYSGEEVGLIGSTAWVRENPEKIGRTAAMINMDMIGRVREGKVSAMGTSSSKDWEKLLEGIKPPGLEIAVSPAIATNSDHAAFARAQVPIVFFHSGLHEEYHTEKDTADTINFDGMLGTVRAVAELVKRVDAREERLAWNPDARMGQRQGQGRGVRLGLLPDMNGTGPGVLLQGVATDSPAAKAGLKTGDRVVKIGAAEVKDMESLQAAFGGLRAGQAVEIVVIRNGERLTLSITPAAP
jgi:hypothetical protein